MPKMKKHSGIKKRFKATASGGIKRSRCNRRHHAWAKTSKKIRQARQSNYVHSSDVKHIAPLL